MNADLRVLAGKYKGRKLVSPLSKLTHPMGSREKNALFNMLTSYLADATVLDAYAGSGALGVEALSRGAKSVVFVEKSPKISAVIRQNLTNLALECPIFTLDIAKFAENPDFRGYFSLVLADPPYDGFRKEEITLLVNTLQLDGILALSFSSSIETPTFSGLELLTTRTYAGAGIAIYRKTTSVDV